MENKRNERDNYVRHGLIVACIVCIIGVCFNMSKVALAGAILLCVVQLVDLIWYIIEIKCKDCKNIKQVFCRCKDIEIIKEWKDLEVRIGKCSKCGKILMIDDKRKTITNLNVEDCENQMKLFDMMSKLHEEIYKLDVMAQGVLKIDDNGITKTNDEKENKE